MTQEQVVVPVEPTEERIKAVLRETIEVHRVNEFAADYNGDHYYHEIRGFDAAAKKLVAMIRPKDASPSIGGVPAAEAGGTLPEDVQKALAAIRSENVLWSVRPPATPLLPVEVVTSVLRAQAEKIKTLTRERNSTYAEYEREIRELRTRLRDWQEANAVAWSNVREREAAIQSERASADRRVEEALELAVQRVEQAPLPAFGTHARITGRREALKIAAANVRSLIPTLAKAEG